jgi:hypothetical protein
MKLLAIDLFCGLGGWAEGFLSEGYEVTGYDIERHDYGHGTYPGELVIQDVLALNGAEFAGATVIVASPPCQAYSYRAMPWKRAKALPPPDNSLFDACFRIQREAIATAGHHIPLIVENVRGAEKWVGRAKWHFGSYYLWGDVPALMPVTMEVKISGQNWARYLKTGKVSPHWRLQGLKLHEGTSIRRRAPHTPHLTNQCEHIKQPELLGTGRWFDDGMARYGSNDQMRKQASAEIAKIPFPLAQHIARCFKTD